LTARRHEHTATLLQTGKVLLAGGAVPSPSDPTFFLQTASAELYDPATGTFTATGSLNEARLNHSALLLPNGKVLIVGGQHSDFCCVQTAELYDPTTGTFAPTSNMPNGGLSRFDSPPALLTNGTVLQVGGDGAAGLLSSSDIFDPATGLFSPGPALLSGVSFHTMTTLTDGKVLIAGGGNAAGGIT